MICRACIAQLRSDGAGIHTLIARAKAFTVRAKQPSGNLMKLIADKPIMQPYANMRMTTRYFSRVVFRYNSTTQ
ncbi:hypothetical protein OH492_27435 [Vibrio chagasii]|nr:hypothetical protein [Vibrio chagasii]